MLIPDFYKILEFDETDNLINASIFLNKDHEIYKGHFPGQPVVPGVMQLQLIKELVEKNLNSELMFSDITFTKYLNMIDPGTASELNVKITIKKLEANQFKIDAQISDHELVFTKLRGVLSQK